MPLQRLVDVEVEDAPWFDLGHCAACEVKRLFASFKEAQRFIALDDKEELLVTCRLDQLLVSGDSGT